MNYKIKAFCRMLIDAELKEHGFWAFRIVDP